MRRKALYRDQHLMNYLIGKRKIDVKKSMSTNSLYLDKYNLTNVICQSMQKLVLTKIKRFKLRKILVYEKVSRNVPYLK